tara:strand:- start:209 stop:475 length:267 start_codon:yes stop_codon:yes gene_type:complete
MKKLLIGSAVYFSMVGAVAITNELSKEDRELLDKIEIKNTCESMLWWFQQDLENNRIDSIAFESYTNGVKNILERHNRINCENCDEID